MVIIFLNSAVNLLAYAYGSVAAPNANSASGAYAIQAATFAYSQINKILPTAILGLTPMIGQSTVQGEIFTLADAAQVTKWAKSVNYVNLLSFRTANRDMAGKSGVTQTDYAFGQIFGAL